MSMGELNTPLTLSTVCGGKLEEEFQAFYPAVLAQLKEGDKATITINIELKRVPDTSSMVNLGYKITPKFPAKTKASICQLDDEFKLRTEPLPEPIKIVNMFQEVNSNDK